MVAEESTAATETQGSGLGLPLPGKEKEVIPGTLDTEPGAALCSLIFSILNWAAASGARCAPTILPQGGSPAHTLPARPLGPWGKGGSSRLLS